MREAVMRAQAERVKRFLDHKILNEIIDVPTSENIARYILNMLQPQGIKKVQVIRDSIGFGVETEAE
jgi:6-pyruvoyltetrahydropterin/6-carboxytetrahydropterin synthase